MNNFNGPKVNINKSIINLKIIIFILILVIILQSYIVVSPLVIKTIYGPNVDQQISQKFENAIRNKYECLFIGSSEMYRAINPQLINVKSYNFSLEMESFNQQWYKLRYLEENNIKFKYLVLGLDFPDFADFEDKRNYSYKPYFENKYFSDYKLKTSIKDINDEFNAYVYGNYIRKIPDFIKAIFINSKILNSKESDKFTELTQDGQLVTQKLDGIDFLNRATITKKPIVIEIQKKYFENT